jgi:hypothetical protein
MGGEQLRPSHKLTHQLAHQGCPRRIAKVSTVRGGGWMRIPGGRGTPPATRGQQKEGSGAGALHYAHAVKTYDTINPQTQKSERESCIRHCMCK